MCRQQQVRQQCSPGHSAAKARALGSAACCTHRGDYCNSLVIPFFTVPCRALHSRICPSRHACCMYARSPIRTPGTQVVRAADDCLSLGGPNVYAGMSRYSGFGHFSSLGLGRCWPRRNEACRASAAASAAFAAAFAHHVGSLLSHWKSLRMVRRSDRECWGYVSVPRHVACSRGCCLRF